LSDMRGFDHNM